jgi:hypothetical protein
LEIINKLYYDARPTKYQGVRELSELAELEKILAIRKVRSEVISPFIPGF